MAQGRRPPRRRCQRRARRGVRRDVARQVFLAEKAARLGADTPEVARDRTESFRLVAGATGDGVVRTQFAPPLTLLTVITALVLVVACTNFTNLMFARAEARRREFLIRLAIGAGRWRLIRQSAAECLALAAIAGVLALLFAGWATSMAMSLVSALEPLEPLDFAIELNTRVIGVCRRLRLRRRAVRPVAVHAAGAFDRDLLGASPHRRRWRASGREPDHAHRPAYCLRHPDVRRRPAPPDGH